MSAPAPAPYPLLHPRPLARLGRTLLATGWALAVVGWAPSIERTLQAWAKRVLAALGIRVDLAAPIPQGGQLWVSNHLSWVDPLVYLTLRPSLILAKAEVRGYAGIGSGARKIGLRFVQRSNPLSRAAALRTLRRDLNLGESFLVFPEGTTTQGDGLAPLQEGSLRMAFRMGVTVLPLRLATGDAHYPWVGDATLVPHLKGLARSRGTQVRVHPGPVLDPRCHPDETAWLQAIRTHLQPRPEARLAS